MPGILDVRDQMNDYYKTDKKIELSDRVRKIADAVKKRSKPWDDREMTRTGPEGDGKTPFLSAFESHPDEPYIICLALGIVDSWTESEPLIYGEDILVGTQRPKRPLKEHFSWGIQYDADALGQAAYKDRREELEKRIEAQKKRLFPLDSHHLTDEAKRIFGRENMASINRLFAAGGYQGHTVPDYFKLLRLGIGGTHEEIRKYECNTSDEKKLLLYRAMHIILDGMTSYALLYAEKAEKLAERDPGDADRLKKIAENCRYVSVNRPRTLYQAAQLMWFYSLWDWADCIGRFDQYMYPFYENGDGGEYPKEDITAALFLKFSEHGVHNIPLGGVDPSDGNDATNELSYLMLQTGRALHSVHPRMVIRIDNGTPVSFLDLAVKMWSEGMSDPTVVSDELVIAGLRDYGVSLYDARSYTTLGCQEIEIPGKSNFGCEDGLFNLAKVFEYTLNDGCDRFDGHRIGLATGYVTDYESIDQLWDSFVKQTKYLLKPFIDLCNKGQEIRSANVSKLVKSIYTDDCISRGMHLDEGGAVYNYGVIETAGASAVADSFAAMDKLVFREKKISKKTLKDALDADFKGYERERQMLLNCAPKYGNDDDLPDGYMKRILRMFWKEAGKYRSVRGGVFTGACSLLGSGITFGRGTWAMPDGRHAGEELGNTIGPRTGADKCGLTAMLNSVMKLPLKLGMGGTTVNALIPTDMMDTEGSRAKIRDIITVYMKNGGQMAQITTARKEDMIDAKLHPEKHGDLIVRVGGYSAPFTELDGMLQDEIIKRYSD